MTNHRLREWPKIGELYKIKESFTCFHKQAYSLEDLYNGNYPGPVKLVPGNLILILEHKIVEETKENSWRKSEIFYFLYDKKVLWTQLFQFKNLEEVKE